MNEKYMLQNILTISKSLINLYTNGEIESSNKNIKELMNDHLNKSLSLQYKLYKNMEKNQYYQNIKLESDIISKIYSKLKMTY